MSRLRVVEPQTLLLEAGAVLTGPERIAVVVASGRPSGIVTAGDIGRAVGIAELGGVPDRTGGDLTGSAHDRTLRL